MSEIRSLAPWLKRFLSEHIVAERDLSRNTQASYRDCFKLLLPFVSGKVRKPMDRLTVEDLAVKRILQFLSDLEDNRGCSVQTRNQRLSAIRAFARFIASRDPGHLDWCSQVSAITTKKGAYILSLTGRFAGCRGPVLVAMRSPKSGFSGHGSLCYVRTD